MISLMDCRNCGAPMELFERRRYYFCPYCGTFHFIDTPPIEGIRILERGASPLPCPLCSAPLAKSLLDDAHVVEHCEQCRGVLLARVEFADAIAHRRARESGPPATPAPLDHRELKRHLLCPSCRRGMDVHPYYGPGNVVIDSCSQCNLIWLDFGELKQITDAPGRDRGKKPEPVVRGTDHGVEASVGTTSGRPRSLMDVFDFLDGFENPNDD